MRNIFSILSIFIATLIFGQSKINLKENQLWVGYMTTAKLSDHYSLWNDAHFATNNFLILRHGLTYKINDNINVTGGFAWGYLNFGSDNDLKRLELRPWSQIFWTSKPHPNWQIQQRIRYDARFKQSSSHGELLDGEYDFNHRVRYMVGARVSIDGKPLNSNSTFLAFNNETLLNFGDIIKKNNLDQNRTSVFIGKNFGKSTVQVGYMYRFVPQSADFTYKHYHSLTIWIFQNFDFRKDKNVERILP